MRSRRPTFVIALVILQVTSCFAHHIAVVVNKNNPTTDITSPRLAKIVRSDTKKWRDGTALTLVLHRASKEETIVLQKLTKASPQTSKSGGAMSLIEATEVASDADVMDTVEANPGAIGFVDVRSVNNKVKVIKVDGKLPMESGYLPD